MFRRPTHVLLKQDTPYGERTLMCRPILTIALIAVLTRFAFAQAPTTLPTTQPLSGKLGTPIELFNGKDLTGWSWFSPTEGAKLDQTWSVVDGAMHMTGKPN